MNYQPLVAIPSRYSASPIPKIVRSLPSPALYPGDLTWDGQHLWHLDKKENRFFKIDAETGEVLRRFILPTGVNALVGVSEGVWLCNTLAGKIYKWDSGEDSQQPSQQRLIFVAPLPIRYRTEGGLAFDGTHLWYADARAGKISAMQLPTNSEEAVIERVIETDAHISCLGFIGETIYFIQRGKSLLGVLDISSSRPTRYFDLPGVPAGVTFDGRDFWYVDGQLRQINQLRF